MATKSTKTSKTTSRGGHMPIEEELGPTIGGHYRNKKHKRIATVISHSAAMRLASYVYDYKGTTANKMKKGVKRKTHWMSFSRFKKVFVPHTSIG